MPSPASISADGISSTAAMIGPRFSIAIERRCSVSREPLCSSELASMRQRIQANAFRILNIG